MMKYNALDYNLEPNFNDEANIDNTMDGGVCRRRTSRR